LRFMHGMANTMWLTLKIYGKVMVGKIL